jgi:trans-aconitate methyltransferase
MTWKFDKAVAKTFAEHVRRHIPNYEQVINQSVEICNLYKKDSKIIDVGCAIGETLTQLHTRGFTNIYGVDNSQDMLDQCPKVATLINSNSFPIDVFDVVLINWTLHFIKDKEQYLKDVFANLAAGGTLVLSEKTSLDPFAIKMYHNFKRSQGVSEEEIRIKEQRTKDVMFIDSADWYLTMLKNIGFSKVYIINASWCFTTFVCVKS